MKIYGIIEYLVLITKGIPVSFSAVLGVYIVTGFFLITITLFNVLVDLRYLGTAGGTVLVQVNSPAPSFSTCDIAISGSDLCDPFIMSDLLLPKLLMMEVIDMAGLDGSPGAVVNLYSSACQA